MERATAMVIATHPTTQAHVVNVRRLLSCIPAARVILSTSTELVPWMENAFSDIRAQVVSSNNDRLDTGKWCAGLRVLGKLARYRWIVLANDSVFLLRTVPQLFGALASGRYDMVGPVSTSSGWDTSIETSYHIQSFMRGFTQAGVRLWRDYSCSLPPTHHSFSSKRAIVVYHEIGSSQLYNRSRLFSLFDGDAKAAGAPYGRGKPWHHNFTFWNESWPRGFPVAKGPQVGMVCPDHAHDQIGADRGLVECLEAKFGSCQPPHSHGAFRHGRESTRRRSP